MSELLTYPQTPFEIDQPTIENGELSKAFNLVVNARPNNDIDFNNAPFKNYADNRNFDWDVVSVSDVEGFLGKLHTINTDDLIDSAELIGVLDGGEKLIEVNTDNIVCLAGMNGFFGRARGIEKDFRLDLDQHTRVSGRLRHSLKVAMMYAGAPTEPPLPYCLRAYIQPNGEVIIDNESGDSHRILAQMLRGYPKIATEKLKIYRINQNLFVRD